MGQAKGRKKQGRTDVPAEQEELDVGDEGDRVAESDSGEEEAGQDQPAAAAAAAAAETVQAPAAVLRALDRFLEELSEEQVRVLRKRTRRVSQPPPEEEGGQAIPVVVFNLGDESYAVEATYVQTIEPLGALTVVPCTPDFVRGVVNLRGQILSVIDLMRFMGLGKLDMDGEMQVLSVRGNGLELGILANQVQDVRPLQLADLTPALSTVGSRAAAYTKGLTADMVVLLDLELLLQEDRLVVWEEVT
ncbi:MAG: chemotaxis protein CheW [Chloroflexia bacterium]|nr:chemotaxis protein CheW [Chloroflexia bacterium]